MCHFSLAASNIFSLLLIFKSLINIFYRRFGLGGGHWYYLRFTQLLKYIHIFIYLFIWLHWVLVSVYSIFGCGMQTLSYGMSDLFPWPGIEPRLPALECSVLAPGPSRKSLLSFLNLQNYIFCKIWEVFSYYFFRYFFKLTLSPAQTRMIMNAGSFVIVLQVLKILFILL